MRKKLVFVYNADSGVFNTLTDIAHKIFSPQTYSCQLCAISHSYFSERDEWRDFINGLDADCEFLHRDEFNKIYTGIDENYPVLFKKSEDKLTLCLSAADINSCKTMKDLKNAISKKCVT